MSKNTIHYSANRETGFCGSELETCGYEILSLKAFHETVLSSVEQFKEVCRECHGVAREEILKSRERETGE